MWTVFTWLVKCLRTPSAMFTKVLQQQQFCAREKLQPVCRRCFQVNLPAPKLTLQHSITCEHVLAPLEMIYQQKSADCFLTTHSVAYVSNMLK